jgi:hypothetical protein
MNTNHIEWEVEKILKKKYLEDGTSMYKVKWVGSDITTWEEKKELVCPLSVSANLSRTW